MLRRQTVCWIAFITAITLRSAAADENDLGVGGYCPVSYFAGPRPVLGDSANSASFGGQLYYLADPESKAKFVADPEQYVPQFGGLCTTALGGTYGNRITSDPTMYRVVEGKLYMFSSLRARNNFDSKPQEYIAQAKERFAKPAIGGYSPVAYIAAGKPAKGDEKFQQVYRALIYHFQNAEELSSFKKEPTKYVPAYGGFCTVGVADLKRFPGDPTVFAVKDGKTYLFFDAAAKKRFDENPAELITKADAGWREISRSTPAPGVNPAPPP